MQLLNFSISISAFISRLCSNKKILFNDMCCFLPNLKPEKLLKANEHMKKR